jgi:hypothetical protein
MLPSAPPRLRSGHGARHLAGALFLLAWTTSANAQSQDPLASNNAVYPSAEEWNRGFRISNFSYPIEATPRWRPGAGLGALTTANAPQYMAALKQFLAADVSGLVNDPLNWSPTRVGWYDMPWMAQGSKLPDGRTDPNSGREALMGSHTGQILEPSTFPSLPPTVKFQNHAVIYYNDVAGTMLGRLWKDPYDPDLRDPQFPQGSIVVKVEAATLTPAQWPAVAGSTRYWVYRPTVSVIEDPKITYKTPSIVPVYFSQLAVAIKDSVASPETGWVYLGFAYDANAKGATVWDKAVPVGAMWGNDPQFAGTPSGKNPNGPLLQTWVNPQAPAFARDTLGWGGRLAGPMDVATRHNVLTPSGRRYQGNTTLAASACLSCHAAAQFPFTENLYPSPNKVFPEDGQPFLLYDPGSPEWARWFQTRPGTQPLSGPGRAGIVALDYDMLLTFALGTFHTAAGHSLVAQPRIRIH